MKRVKTKCLIDLEEIKNSRFNVRDHIENDLLHNAMREIKKEKLFNFNEVELMSNGDYRNKDQMMYEVELFVSNKKEVEQMITTINQIKYLLPINHKNLADQLIKTIKQQ